MDQLTDYFYIKFRNDAPAFRKLGQLLCPGENFANQSLANVRHMLFGVPGKNALKVAQRGFGELDRRHKLHQSEPLFRIRKAYRPPFVNVRKTLQHRLHKRPLFAIRFIVLE